MAQANPTSEKVRKEEKVFANRSTTQKIPVFALSLVGLFTFAVIFGPLIAPFGPNETNFDEVILPPAWQDGGTSKHLLGTDPLGRDILSRIIYGARITLLLSLSCILLYGTIGVTVGLISGYFGGTVDMILMRLTDLWMSLPVIILAIILATTFGPGMNTVIVSVGIMGWPYYARIFRGEALSLKEQDFVRLARVAGANNMRIILAHLFPNIVNTLIILLTLDIGLVIILTATLSFLGLGTQPPSCDWGLMLFEGRQYFHYAWWLITFPGVAILIAVLGFNMTGDWLRDILDPKQKPR